MSNRAWNTPKNIRNTGAWYYHDRDGIEVCAPPHGDTQIYRISLANIRKYLNAREDFVRGIKGGKRK